MHTHKKKNFKPQVTQPVENVRTRSKLQITMKINCESTAMELIIPQRDIAPKVNPVFGCNLTLALAKR